MIFLLDTDAAASSAGLGQGCVYDLHFLLSHVTCAMCSPVTHFLPRALVSLLCLYLSSFSNFCLLIVLKESRGSRISFILDYKEVGLFFIFGDQGHIYVSLLSIFLIVEDPAELC